MVSMSGGLLPVQTLWLTGLDLYFGGAADWPY
jgi:hypothetical protein